ncbi:hypothetical protein [Ectobacillus sp. sgz5001026]|uniref:hypothetical protein n=1 Tax=Ectobacillus sp. sgz5001026 TaxID=3242473 RepID=UPI0036D2DB04
MTLMEIVILITSVMFISIIYVIIITKGKPLERRLDLATKVGVPLGSVMSIIAFILVRFYIHI